MKSFLSVCMLLSVCFSLKAQENNTSSPIIFIYDASGSMWGKMDNSTKMQIGAKVLSNTINQLPGNQQIGFVAYGHRQKGDCQDVEFLVDATNTDKGKVNQVLTNIKPLGKTPLAYSAIQVIEKIKSSDLKSTIILITDGIESCGGDICEVIRKAKEAGVNFRLHIVGFGLKDDETEQLRCAADAGDGNYYDAGDSEGLSDVLIDATKTTVDKPIGNFTLYASKNGAPLDASVQAFDAGGKKYRASARTYGDTASMYLPEGKYTLKVQALENTDLGIITLEDIVIKAGEDQHKDVPFDGGKIEVFASNNGEPLDAVIKIYSKGNGKLVANGRTYGKADVYEVPPGSVDVEVKALKINGTEIIHRIEDVAVIAGGTKKVEHNFKSGTLIIGASSSAGLVDATVNIIEVNSKKNVARSRTYKNANSNPKTFVLNPGTYEVRIKALGDHAGKTANIKVTIGAEQTVEKIHQF